MTGDIPPAGITYGDRTTASMGIVNMVAMGGASGWRLDGVGTPTR